MCDRTTAMRRLIEAYLRTLTSNPDYLLQVSLSDMLDERNIEVVQKLDLYAELGRPRVAEVLSDLEPERRLLNAWMAERPIGGRLS
jgi:hypothetical protein